MRVERRKHGGDAHGQAGRQGCDYYRRRQRVRALLRSSYSRARGPTVVFGDVLDDEGRKVEAKSRRTRRQGRVYPSGRDERGRLAARRGSRREQVREPGHPGQQRGHHVEARRAWTMSSEDWDLTDGSQRQGRVPWYQVRGPRDAARRRRLDCQHFLR